MAKVYVGNLSWGTTDESLRNAFISFGQITDSIVMRDRETGRSRGFGFVTYGSEQEADAAILAMNEQELDGRRIKVNLANARPGGGAAPFGGASNNYQGQGGGGGGYNPGPGGYGGQPQGGAGGGYGGYPQGGGGYQGSYQGGGGGYQPSAGYGGYSQQGGYPPSGGYGGGGGY